MVNDSTQLIDEYVRLALKWNRVIGLFSRRFGSRELGMLIEESILGGNLLKGKATSVLDIGSGGGIPAVPLKIVMPQMEFHLCEANQKKALFLEEVIRKIPLPGTTVRCCRIEDLPVGVAFDAVTIRGLLLSSVAKYIQPHLVPGGLVLVFHPPKDSKSLIAAAALGWERFGSQVLRPGDLEASLFKLHDVPRGTFDPS